MKRENSSLDITQGSENRAKRDRSDDTFEVRILIPSRVVGSIIGKSGSNIQKLRNDNKATIRIPNCDGPERVMSIQVHDAVSAVEIIRQSFRLISEDRKSRVTTSNHSQRPNENEIRLLVHQSIVGGVIGKAGSVIKQIRELSGSQIKVYGTCAPQSTDRCVSVQGLIEQNCEALKEIFKIIRSTEIKGGDRPYDPNYFDVIYAKEYGGYGNEKDLSLPSNFSRGEMNSHKFAMPKEYQFGDMMQGYQTNFQVPWHGRNSFANIENNGPVKTTKVTIPKDMGGAIIGKGGYRIGKIRQDSNADIKILEAKEGSEERIISITGTDQSILTAQYLLQQCVKQNYKSI